MNQMVKFLSLAASAVPSALARAFDAPPPAGWQVGSARWKYEEFERGHGVSATRYGDWEYSGRCTDF